MYKTIVLLGLLMASTACRPDRPAPIRYGSDACSHCKMTILDRKYAATLLTSKGRTHPFDAVECLVGYLAEHGSLQPRVVLVTDYARPGTLTDARTAYYLHSEGVASPMGGHLAAFATGTCRDSLLARLGGQALRWQDLKNLSLP